MTLPRRIIRLLIIASLVAPSTTFTAPSPQSQRASHRLYDTSLPEMWSSIAATAVSPSETLLTTVSLASVSALVGAANAGLAARERQRQAEMKEKLQSQQVDLGKFQKSVENLNRLAQVLTATGTLSAAYVLLNVVPLIDQSSKIPPASTQVLAEKRAAVRSASQPASTIADLKLPVNQKFDAIVKDSMKSSPDTWIKEKEDKMNALLEKKRDQLLSDSNEVPSTMKTQSVTIADGAVKSISTAEAPKAEVKKEDSKKEEGVKVEAKKDEPKKSEVDVKKEDSKSKEMKSDVKKEEPKSEVKKEEVKVESKKDETTVKKEEGKPEVKKDEVKAEGKKEEPKQDEVKAEVKKDEPKKDEVKAEVKKEEPKKDEVKAEVKKEEPKKDEVKAEVKKEEPKKDEVKNEGKKEPKNDEVKAEVKKEVPKKDEVKAEVKKEVPKKDEVKAEVKKEEVKAEAKVETKKNDPTKDSIKASAPTEDKMMDRLMTKMDEVKTKEPETFISSEKKIDEPALKETQAEKKEELVATKKEEASLEKKEQPVAEKKASSEEQKVISLSSPPSQTVSETVKAPVASVEVRKPAVEAAPADSIGPIFQNAAKSMDAFFTGIGRTTSSITRQVTNLLPRDVAKEFEKVNDKEVGLFTSVAFLATTVGGFVIAATRDDEPDSKKKKEKPINGENRALRNNGINGDTRSVTEISDRFGQKNAMESSSRLPPTDTEKRNGFGSYLDQISRGDSQSVNGARASGSMRDQNSPSAWNATGLSDPDSWDPRDFDPLTQSLSGRSVPQSRDEQRQSLPRATPPVGVSQPRPNSRTATPINQSQSTSQNRPSTLQRVPSNNIQRPPDRNGANQAAPRATQSERKPTWTPTSNSAPYTNPSTLMPTDVTQLSQPPLQGEPVQRTQERNRPERPPPPQAEKRAPWTPPSNNAPYTNPSTLMPTDVTPVDGDSYLGSLSSSSTSTRPRGSYNPFGRPVASSTGSPPTGPSENAARPRTITAGPTGTSNDQASPVGAARNSNVPSPPPDTRSPPEPVGKRPPERSARGSDQTDRAPIRNSEPSSAPTVFSRSAEPTREESFPQRTMVTPQPTRRPQSPLVPADLIRPVEPDITSVTRTSSRRSDTNESRTQPSAAPRNGFFPQRSPQASTRDRNGANANNAASSGQTTGESPSGTSETRRVDSSVGPDQPRPNRTPWISSGSSNEQSDYNPRSFDPRTQSFRETSRQ